MTDSNNKGQEFKNILLDPNKQPAKPAEPEVIAPAEVAAPVEVTPATEPSPEVQTAPIKVM